ncbi:hypothetical protein [Rhodoferax sp.]|nr:hypothetical protein [Rhodoferax sp.]MBE0472650.1 hypothetical protein [Rhodoferax sp.]
MSEAALTSKGQITIPSNIRKSMSIKDLKGMLKSPPGVSVPVSDMRMGGD